MKLRKRKPIEKQVEILDHSDEETKDISVSFSNEEERPSNKILGGNKRIKLEEAKMVLDETVKSEDEGGGLKLYKENSNGEKVNKGVRIKRSTYECDICDRVYRWRISLSNHLNTHKSSDKSFKCNLCDKAYKFKDNLSRHKRKKHLPEEKKIKYECEVCNRVTDNKRDYFKHLQVHLPKEKRKKFSCSICEKEFFSRSGYYLHINTHRPAESKPKFTCSLCDKVFSARGGLNQHRYTHLSQEERRLSFRCKVCDKQFESGSGLWSHKFIHKPNIEKLKKHECSSCNKRFRTKSTLKIHAQTHLPLCKREELRMIHVRQEICRKYQPSRTRAITPSDESSSTTIEMEDTYSYNLFILFYVLQRLKWKCSTCDEDFASYNRLTYHRQSHRTEEEKLKYTCTTCNKYCISLKCLRKHQQTHLRT